MLKTSIATVKHTILIVDDCENDARLLDLALKRCGVKNPIQKVQDGAQALEYLMGLGSFEDRSKFPLPSIIFLDWRMPKKDGREVLTWLGQRAEFRRMLIIVLTGLEDRSCIDTAYEMGANSFLSKPFTSDDLDNLLAYFSGYWEFNSRVESAAARSQTVSQNPPQVRSTI